MAGNNIDKRPLYSELETYKVRAPVTAASLSRWTNALDFQLGFNKHHVASNFYAALTSSAVLSSTETHFQYWKSPGAELLLVEAEFQTSVTSSRDCIPGITPPSGAVWVGTTSPFDTSVAAGLRTALYPLTGTSNPPVHRAFLDVSNVSTASIQDFTVTLTNNTNAALSDTGHGLHRLNVVEVPRSTFDVVHSSSGGIGVAEGWNRPGQFLYAGHVTASLGFVRLQDQLDAARSKIRKHWQIGTHSDAARYWYGNTGVDVDLNYQMRASGDKRYHYLKVRNLYGSASLTSNYTFRTWYKTSSAGGSYKLTIWHRPYGSVGPYTGVDLTCPPSTTWTTASASVGLLTTGTNHEVEFYFTTWIITSNVSLHVQNIALIEAEA